MSTTIGNNPFYLGAVDPGLLRAAKTGLASISAGNQVPAYETPIIGAGGMDFWAPTFGQAARDTYAPRTVPTLPTSTTTPAPDPPSYTPGTSSAGSDANVEGAAQGGGTLGGVLGLLDGTALDGATQAFGGLFGNIGDKLAGLLGLNTPEIDISTTDLGLGTPNSGPGAPSRDYVSASVVPVEQEDLSPPEPPAPTPAIGTGQTPAIDIGTTDLGLGTTSNAAGPAANTGAATTGATGQSATDTAQEKAAAAQALANVGQTQTPAIDPGQTPAIDIGTTDLGLGTTSNGPPGKDGDGPPGKDGGGPPGKDGDGPPGKDGEVAGGTGADSSAEQGGYSQGGMVAPNRLLPLAPINAAKAALSNISAHSQGYADGGVVDGSALQGPNPPGPDQGFAALQPGEFVVRKDAAQRPGIAPLLDMINRGVFPRGTIDGNEAQVFVADPRTGGLDPDATARLKVNNLISTVMQEQADPTKPGYSPPSAWSRISPNAVLQAKAAEAMHALMQGNTPGYAAGGPVTPGRLMQAMPGGDDPMQGGGMDDPMAGGAPPPAAPMPMPMGGAGEADDMMPTGQMGEMDVTPQEAAQNLAMLDPQSRQALAQAISDPQVMNAILLILGQPFVPVVQQMAGAPGPLGMVEPDADQMGGQPDGDVDDMMTQPSAMSLAMNPTQTAPLAGPPVAAGMAAPVGAPPPGLAAMRAKMALRNIGGGPQQPQPGMPPQH